MGTFAERTRTLERHVGDGTLTGRVVVDQVYARYQHEREDLRHPRGGQAKYLSTPLRGRADEVLREIARTLYQQRPESAVRRFAEQLADDVAVYAPVLFNNLRRSGAPSVIDDGAVSWSRPPQQRRLSDAELRVQGRRRP